MDDLIRTLPGYDPFKGADDYWFDYDAANRALEFFVECVTHVKGELAGTPYLLEDHEMAITANIFGWKDKDGYRRYKECFYFVPRKNSKTTWAAGLALKVFFDDGEFGAECYCAAADKEQATLLFGQTAAMVRNYEDLDNAVTIYNANKSIVYFPTNTSFKAISADAATKHGYNSHLVIVDELHAQPNRDLVDVLCTSTGSRKQPLIVYITTSDFERPSICNEKHHYAAQVRDGIIDDPTFLPVIYEATLDDDWTDPETWYKANPNLGKSVSYEYIERECKRAQETPSFENTFKRLHLNIRTEQDVRWLQMHRWDQCNTDVDPDALKGRECYAGLDLSSTTDISSLCLVFPDWSETPVVYDVLSFNWIPGDNAHRRERKDRVPYIAWSNQGFVSLSPGDVIDYDAIRNKINELGEIYDIRSICIDRWAATQITTQLTGDGFDVIPFGQGFASMSAPTKELEKVVLGKQVRHGGNPVLRWSASNVTVESDAAGNLKPSKKKSTERIDPIVSMVMALGGAIAAEQAMDYRIY